MEHIDNYKLFEARNTPKVTKVDFEWKDMKFKNISLKQWSGGALNNPILRYYVPIGAVSQVVRQYIKQKFKVPFQISSSSYAGGDSIRTYFSPLNVDKEKFEEIRKDLEITFSDGQFDGMEDIYNYGDNVFTIKFGEQNLDFGTKYFFAEYRPKYGTKEYDKWEKS